MCCQANSKHASPKVKCNTYKDLRSTNFSFLLKDSSWSCTKKKVAIFCFILDRSLSSVMDFVHEAVFVICMLIQGVSGFRPFHMSLFVLDCIASANRLSEMQVCEPFFFSSVLSVFIKQSKMTEAVSRLLFTL